jgi:hypothetical protein
MHRTDMVALAAGTTVGIGGGALGAFLICTAGQIVVHRFLDQFDDQYFDFRPPALPTARHGVQQARLAGASVSQRASDRPSRTVPIA